MLLTALACHTNAPIVLAMTLYHYKKYFTSDYIHNLY